jgi:hypothetical protein
VSEETTAADNESSEINDIDVDALVTGVEGVGDGNPRRLPRMASGSISLKDADQVLTDDDKRQRLAEVYTSWDDSGEEEGGSNRLLLLIIPVVVVVAVALLIVQVVRHQSALVPDAPIAEPVEEERLPYVKQDDLRVKIEAAVKVLCESQDPEAILSVIRQPEELGSLIRDYYRERPLERREVLRVDLPENSTLHSTEDRVLLKAVVSFADGGQRMAALEWAGTEPAIDWKHWVHWQPIPVADFLEGKALPDGVAPEFRVAVRFPAGFRPSESFPEESYRCLILRDPVAHGDDFVAYVRRETRAEAEIIRVMDLSKTRPMMLGLARADDRQVEVIRFVADGWVRRLW